MPLRRLSLHSVVALSLLGMGIVALVLVLLASRIYRDVSHENRVSAVQDLLRHQAANLTDGLADAQRIFGLRLTRDTDFREAWRAGDTGTLQAALERALAAQQQDIAGYRFLRVRALDAALEPLAAAGAAGDAVGCPDMITQARAGSPDTTVSRTCLRDDGAALSVLVPVAGTGPAGYVEIVSDPVGVLRRIGDDAKMAVRIERPGGTVLYESPDWPALASGPNAVTARYLSPGDTGDPVFAIRAAADVALLNRQLADTRDFVLLAAGLIVAAAMLIALVTLRRMLQPLRALQSAAERVSRDAGVPADFTPVSERAPDEIATPIRSFNHMVQRIGRLLADLESEVGQRREAEAAATSARDLAEENARRAFQEKEFSHITLESVVDAVIATDVGGRIEYMNPVAEELTGVVERNALGRTVDEVVQLYDPDGETRREGLVTACLRGETRPDREVARLVHRSGRVLYVDHAIVPMHDTNDAVVGAVLVFHDVTQAQMLTERLTYQATHDALTGLINRYEFEVQMRNVVDAVCEDDSTGVLCYLDLDQFKLVNDTCGHGAGDELLRQLAVMMTDRLRDRGTLARLGGDEFGLLLHPCTIPEARTVAHEMRDAIQRFRFVWGQSIFTIGVSIGVVEIGRDSEGTDLLLSAADTACYMAKDAGRNRVQVYETDDEALLERHAEMHWVSEINRALEQDRLCLYCQDIVATSEENPSRHFEILVRMVDEEGHVWLPGSFLSAAERYNLAPAIDQWVVRKTLRWLAANEVPPEAVYAINLSGRSLTDDGFMDFVLAELDANDVRPQNLCFEITETAAISNLSYARTFMETLRAHGCRFSLDDFGSGLSSFTYLKNLPVDYLKIDGSFVRDIHLDRVHYSIVRSMNDVGHAMGMATVAEFVENEEIMHCLREIGVDFLQGFQYSRPHPLEPAAALIAATRD